MGEAKRRGTYEQRKAEGEMKAQKRAEAMYLREMQSAKSKAARAEANYIRRQIRAKQAQVDKEFNPTKKSLARATALVAMGAFVTPK